MSKLKLYSYQPINYYISALNYVFGASLIFLHCTYSHTDTHTYLLASVVNICKIRLFRFYDPNLFVVSFSHFYVFYLCTFTPIFIHEYRWYLYVYVYAACVYNKTFCIHFFMKTLWYSQFIHLHTPHACTHTHTFTRKVKRTAVDQLLATTKKARRKWQIFENAQFKC